MNVEMEIFLVTRFHLTCRDQCIIRELVMK